MLGIRVLQNYLSQAIEKPDDKLPKHSMQTLMNQCTEIRVYAYCTLGSAGHVTCWYELQKTLIRLQVFTDPYGAEMFIMSFLSVLAQLSTDVIIRVFQFSSSGWNHQQVEYQQNLKEHLHPKETAINVKEAEMPPTMTPCFIKLLVCIVV